MEHVDVYHGFKGATFYDVMSYFENPYLRNKMVNQMIDYLSSLDWQFDAIAGLDSRGYILASILADRLERHLIMVRKAGKLPVSEVESSTLEIKRKSVQPGTRVLIVDDLLDTGDSVCDTCQLLEKCGAVPIGCIVMYDVKLTDCKCPVPHISMLNNLDNGETLVPYHGSPTQIPTSDPDIVVFSGPDMEYFRDILVQSNPNVRTGLIDWDTFPDGWPNIQFDTDLRDKIVFWVFSTKVENVFRELALIKVLPRQGIKDLHILIPYFPPGTMERVDCEGTLTTAEPFAKMLSELEITRSGPVKIHLFDIHTFPERFYFGQNVIVNLHSAISLFIKEHLNKSLTICFPDTGTYRRYINDFKQAGFPVITCNKVRNGDQRIITCEDLDLSKPYMQRVVIVDNICHSGGTLNECRKLLMQMGVKQVDAFVVHMVGELGGYLDFTPSGKKSGFTNFYTTNSTPTSRRLHGLSPFKVYDLQKLISHDINIDGQYVLAPSHSISTHQVRQIRILVGSSSQVKLKAVYNAYYQYYVNTGYHLGKIKVFGVKNVPSGVKNQPFEYLEDVSHIETGSQNRLNYIRQHYRGFDHYVGMESGIVIKPGLDDKEPVYMERTYISMVIPKYQTAVVEHGFIPEQYVPDKSGNIKAGSIIAEDYGCHVDDWHYRLYGLSRSDAISDKIYRILHSQ